MQRGCFLDTTSAMLPCPSQPGVLSLTVPISFPGLCSLLTHHHNTPPPPPPHHTTTQHMGPAADRSLHLGFGTRSAAATSEDGGQKPFKLRSFPCLVYHKACDRPRQSYASLCQYLDCTRTRWWALQAHSLNYFGEATRPQEGRHSSPRRAYRVVVWTFVSSGVEAPQRGIHCHVALL